MHNSTENPGLWQRFKAAVKALKRSVLALYYAAQDPRTGWLPRTLAVLVVAYAVSPLDLIPDFIPVLGLIDDLLILPGLIWLAIKLVPADAWAAGLARADTEPLRLADNWAAACFVLLLWDGLIVASVHFGLHRWGSQQVLRLEWAVLSGLVGALLLAEGLWVGCHLHREHRLRLLGQEQAAAAAAEAEQVAAEPDLSTGLLAAAVEP